MTTYSDTKINKAAKLSLRLTVPGDTLLHHSGRRYYVSQVANNNHDLNDPRFPPTLVYRPTQGPFDGTEVYARPVKDLIGKMMNITITEERIKEALEFSSLGDY